MGWPMLKWSGLALFLLASCGGGSAARVEPVYNFSATDQAVEDFLAETPSLAGAGLIVVHREWGVLHHRAFGAFGLDRVSLVASASKMVSAGSARAHPGCSGLGGHLSRGDHSSFAIE